MFKSHFLFGLEVLNCYSFIISNPSLSRIRLFRGPSPSKKGFSNSLYKGFIVVKKIDREIDFNKIPAAYLSFAGVIA